MTLDFDVVVVAAGPAGSSGALELARGGRTLVAAPAWEALAGLLAASVRPGATVLDAGTGTGEATVLLLERADPAEVIAVDVSKGMLHAARKKIADPRVEWTQHDVTRLSHADESADVLDPRDAARSAARSTRVPARYRGRRLCDLRVFRAARRRTGAPLRAVDRGVVLRNAAQPLPRGGRATLSRLRTLPAAAVRERSRHCGAAAQVLQRR